MSAFFSSVTSSSATLSLLASIVFSFVVGSLSPAGAEDSLREAVECHPRHGLPNFIAKAEAGETVRVAYLGGSITAAPGWRVQSRDWLAERYPSATIEEIHAAIGGTGSGLGVFRLQQDALRHQPDLLFVEFAVNDGGVAPERIHQSMEGIVRQTWAADPNIDICFVYTLTKQMLGDLQAGRMPRAASAMEVLADHYQIPSIHFGVEVARLESAGELVFQAPKPADFRAKPMVFSTDGVHPHVETGHRVYTETIVRSWPAISKASGSAKPHELKQPLRDDNWQEAKMVPITQEMLSGAWQQLDSDDGLAKRFQRNMSVLYQAKEPGAAIEFTFDGINAGVFDLLGPDGGQVRIELDGKEKTRNRIDGYCTYHRMATLNLGSDLIPGRHTVRIELTPAELDKREILFERNQADIEQKPEKYQEHTWYASSLMLIGDLE